MIPAKAMQRLHLNIHNIATQEPDEFYAILGNDLNDLRALAWRLGEAMDGDEKRDWQNRLNTLLDSVLGPLSDFV